MFRSVILCLLFAFIVPVCVVPERAVAADGKILDATIDRYMNEAAKWEPRIKQAAQKMFWILATISMVFTFAFMFAKGNVGLGDFFGEFLRFIVTVGFFFWLLDNGSEIAKAVIKSFGQLGMEASSTYQSDLSPSNLVSFALELIGRACSTFGEQDIATSVVALLLSIAIAVLFGIIAAMMVQLLCTAWVLVYAGTVVLGFGGGRWTQDIAINYFKTVLGLAIQTFTFCLLVGIGQQQVENLIADSKQVKTVLVKGYVYNSNVSTTAMTITEGCVILLFTVILFMLVKTVPNMVAGIISGSSTGGISLGGGGSAVAGAAALASGGAMIAAQMAGGAMALNSAYQQTKENKEMGAGLFSGASGGGGLSGAMSSGLRSAGDFMANLASGAGSSAKESLQKSTAGGAVSANIDADRQANMAAHEAAKAESEGEGDGGGGGGGDDGAGGAAATSDGGSGGDGSGTIGPGSADNGATALSGAMGGGESDSSQGSSGGSGLSKPGYGSSDGGTSLSKPGYGNSDRGTSLSKPGYGSSEGGTSLSKPGYGSGDGGSSLSKADREWQAALDSYDPSKIGLPDSD